MDDIDKLLARIAPSTSPLNPPSVGQSTDANLDALLSQVKVDLDQQTQLELAQQQENQRKEQHQSELKHQRLEQLKQQRRAALCHDAKTWLNQLKPKSDEGRWFAEFACNYDNPLEAAIDYLEALQTVNDHFPDRPM
jgi:hypothetical protein